MSHVAGYALIALSRSRVGVDVEPIVSALALSDLSFALSPRERADLAVLNPVARRGAMTRAWVRKEAHLKATGEGLNTDPAGVDVGVGAAPRPVRGSVITDVDVPEGYCAAVAALRWSDA